MVHTSRLLREAVTYVERGAGGGKRGSCNVPVRVLLLPLLLAVVARGAAS